MTATRPIRAFTRDALRGLTPADVPTASAPRIEWVEPTALRVEAAYQRGIGGAGTKLIRTIYSHFSWARFKPPIVVEEGDGYVCIDGQHTAIACASHPGIQKIPVMIVSAADVAARASAFVGHNRDRIALTAPTIYFAELASGDAHALAVDRACKAAGATVLSASINLRDKHPVGSTIAVGILRAIIKRQGETFLTRVLRVLVAAGRGPIKAAEIGATAAILGKTDYHGEHRTGVVDGKLTAVIAAKSAETWAAMAAVKAAESGESISGAIAGEWLNALDMRIDLPKQSKRATAGDLVIAATKPKLPPRPQPAQAKATQEITTAPPAPEIWHNGVAINTAQRWLTHRGYTIKIEQDSELRLLTTLARVMPALVDATALAKKAFGRLDQDSATAFRYLVERLNPVLAPAKLEIKVVPKAGARLVDTAA